MKNIVILGAGFGGLRAAIVLGKWIRQAHHKRGSNYQIILIDRNDYHTYTPLLYEISTTSKETANYLDLKSVTTYPVEESLKGLPVEFVEEEIKNLDLANSKVELENKRVVAYDYLILALGSEANFFNIPGLEENAFTLKTFNGALKIRDTVWEKIESASSEGAVDIVIGGAGSTGVELAGEIQEWISQMRKEGYRCRTSVTLIDAAPTILNGFEEKIIKRANLRLKKLGTNILTAEKVSKVESGKLFLESGKIVSYDVLVWTGGVKANSLIGKLPCKLESQGRIAVSPNLWLSDNDNVYVIGDASCLNNPQTGKPVPMVARAAIIQGTIAAKNIIRDIKGKSHLEYIPRNYPYIIPVGGKYAIAKIGNFIIPGFLGWVLKGLVELNYLFSIIPNVRALKIWLRGLKIFIQNDRLG